MQYGFNFGKQGLMCWACFKDNKKLCHDGPCVDLYCYKCKLMASFAKKDFQQEKKNNSKRLQQ